MVASSNGAGNNGGHQHNGSGVVGPINGRLIAVQLNELGFRPAQEVGVMSYQIDSRKAVKIEIPLDESANADNRLRLRTVRENGSDRLFQMEPTEFHKMLNQTWANASEFARYVWAMAKTEFDGSPHKVRIIEKLPPVAKKEAPATRPEIQFDAILPHMGL